MREFFNKAGKLLKSNPDAVSRSGYTRLQRAVADKDLKKVNALIKSGANVNFIGEYNHPPLHMALKLDCPQIVLALIEARADVNLPNELGRRPLHLAVEQAQEAMILTLLDAQADPNAKDDKGRTPLHMVPKNHPQIVDILVKHGARTGEQDREGNTPLHNALNHPLLARQLLDLGADPNIRNNKNISPYMQMLDNGHLSLYPKTLQKKIILRGEFGAAQPLGETLLHLAARLEGNETYPAALTKDELSERDDNGNNLLHALVRTQNALLIAQVAQRVPELVNEVNKRGFTPLEELLTRIDHPLCGFNDNYIATATALLTQGAKIDSADRKGHTLLHHALTRDKLNFMEDLLHRGANANATNATGRTALHMAISGGNLLAMDILLDNRADPDMPDARGWTILDRLAEKEDRDSPIVQRLIVAGGQYQKQLPLHSEAMRRPRLDKGRTDTKKPFTGHTGNPPPGM